MLQNLPDPSIKGYEIQLAMSNIRPVTRLAAHFADPMLKLVPDCLAQVAKPLWSEDLVTRGVLSDPLRFAAIAALMSLHSYVVNSRIDGHRTESQSWPASLDVMVSCVFFLQKVARLDRRKGLV